MAIQFHVYNRSTVVTNDQVEIMTAAARSGLSSFCGQWGLVTPTVTTHPNEVPPVPLPPLNTNEPRFDSSRYPAKNRYIVVFLDTDSSVPGAGGYHTVVGRDTVVAYILSRTITTLSPNRSAPDSGMYVPGGSVAVRGHAGAFNSNVISVSQAYMHEMFEMLVNPLLGTFWYNGNNDQLYYAEVGDAVNFTSTRVTVTYRAQNYVVAVPDFITPAWSDVGATSGFDQAQVLNAPFSSNWQSTPDHLVVGEKPFDGGRVQSIVDLQRTGGTRSRGLEGAEGFEDLVCDSGVGGVGGAATPSKPRSKKCVLLENRDLKPFYLFSSLGK